MRDVTHLVCFMLGAQQFALRLATVERVVGAVEITPLPQAPRIVRGIINVQGQVIPVMDVRRRWGLPERALDLNDQFIIARMATRCVALWVDAVTGVIPWRDEAMTAMAPIAPTPQVEGVLILESGLVLIHNLEAFLSVDEGVALDRALQSS